MKRPQCFGTMLWDETDRHCRDCEVFGACRDMLASESHTLPTGEKRGDHQLPGPQTKVSNDPGPLRASIEQAFSSGPAQASAPMRAPGEFNASAAKVTDSGAFSPKMVPFSTRLPEGLDIDVKVYCALHKKTVQAFVTEAIRDRLAK